MSTNATTSQPVTAVEGKAEIRIVVGSAFTDVLLNGAKVGAKWGPGVGGGWYVAFAGQEPQKFDDEQAATKSLMESAMAAADALDGTR